MPALTPHLPLPAVCGAVEDGEEEEEEKAHSSQASADSFCRVMDILGMGHRLFVPRLLAVRFRSLGWKIGVYGALALAWSAVFFAGYFGQHLFNLLSLQLTAIIFESVPTV